MTESRPLHEVIAELANVITRLGQSQLKEYMNETGLSHSQMMTLSRLYNHGGGGISEMGTHLGTTDAAASQLIERLVNQGLVERIESETDRRMKKIALTPKGRAIFDKMIARRNQMVKQMLSTIPLEKQHLIFEAASALTEAARNYEQLMNLEKTRSDISAAPTDTKVE